MKKILALAAGLVLALAPSGTALADDGPTSNGLGNCGYTAAGGGAPAAGGVDNGHGFGGHVVDGEFVPCVSTRVKVKGPNKFIGPLPVLVFGPGDN